MNSALGSTGAGKVVMTLVVSALAAAMPLFVAAEQPPVVSSAPALSEIVTKMEAARLQSKETAPFLLTREYRMYQGETGQPASQVKAQINVVPPHDSDYKIIESKGSDRGEKIVRKILEHEAKAEKSSPSPTAIVSANYDFELLGREKLQGTDCYLLRIKPKRKDSNLVDGKAWVDGNSYLVRKIEGELAKSPSWMVKQVKLNVHFGEMDGVWTQTSTQAVADVRLLGKYMVNGRAVDLKSSSTEAAKKPAQKKSLGMRVVAPRASAQYSARGMVVR
jgi:hypothetical protein